MAKQRFLRRKVFFFATLILLLAPTLLNIWAVESFSLSKGKWFKWKGELIITGTKVWDITEEIRVIEASESGGILSGQVRIVHKIVELKVGGEKVTVIDNDTTVPFSLEINKDIRKDLFNPIYPVAGLNGLPFTIFTVFNIKKISEVKTYVYSGLTEVPGILKDSWDIVLGTWRPVIYVELYTAKREYVAGAILEFLVTIDKELGIVLSIWTSWYYYGTRYILRLKLADTNAFLKNLFYFTLGGIIVAIIALAIIVRKFLARRK